MSKQSDENNVTEQPLSDEALEQSSGGGQDGSDLLIVNDGDGSDFAEAGEPAGLKDESSAPSPSSSDPEWKYVPVRRTT